MGLVDDNVLLACLLHWACWWTENVFAYLSYAELYHLEAVVEAGIMLLAARHRRFAPPSALSTVRSGIASLVTLGLWRAEVPADTVDLR